jgi:hypothetical protein
VIVAPATTADCGSVTRPRRTEVPWAERATALKTTARAMELERRDGIAAEGNGRRRKRQVPERLAG